MLLHACTSVNDCQNMCMYMYINNMHGINLRRRIIVLIRGVPLYIPIHAHLLQAMDRMEAEWESVILEIVAYKETGTYIMKSGDETAQMLDDHIVMAQAMSFSPYKKPFEVRITTWENKLRLIQV